MRRRAFLQYCALAPAMLSSPGTVVSTPGPRRKILVLIELKGGNDGLSTVIPYTDSAYYRLRPTLAIARDAVLQLDGKTGLHPSLEALLDAWRSDDFAIVQGVGYADPNLSHFRSIEIWDTGTGSDRFSQEGWLSQVLAGWHEPDTLIADGIVLGADSGPLSGPPIRSLVISDPEKFFRNARGIEAGAHHTGNPALDHVLTVESDVRRAFHTLEVRLSTGAGGVAGFPATRFGRQCAVAAQIITGDIPTRVLKLSHGSFDTHANQTNQHRRLLRELAEGLAGLRATLRRAGYWDDVLIMTYSEFGRRAGENGNAGTDHGTAAPHILLGGRVRGGIYGEQPSLTRLDGGNLRYGTDFRSLYATVSASWWGLVPRDNPFSAYPNIGCIRSA